MKKLPASWANYMKENYNKQLSFEDSLFAAERKEAQFIERLISELKNFVASGTSYAAKPGETDDLVMAVLLVVRELQVLQSYHKELDDQMRDHQDITIEPLPFVMSIG